MIPTVPSPDDFADRCLLDFANRNACPAEAIEAVLKAHRLLGVTLGAEIAERRNQNDPLQNMMVDAKLYRSLLHAYQEITWILVEHVQKIHRTHRAHYSPEQRFRILRVKNLLGWTQKETSTCFDIASNTVFRWEAESRSDPDKEALGSLVKPRPPVRRFADVVRHLVQTMAASGFGGNKRIAQTLARAGWKIAAETVRRIRKEKPVPAPKPAIGVTARSLEARHPNHIAMADLTEIPSLFRLFAFKLAVVFDVFSRMPIAARVFSREPTDEDLSELVVLATERSTVPKNFVSDQGAQFTSKLFRKTLRRLDVLHRFGAIGRVGSIALIERFWRTAKSLLGRHRLPPLTQRELERRVDLALYYYAHLRPHQALGGATPAELYFGLLPAHLSASSPPRARPREGPHELPFRIDYLDGERSLPLLVTKAA